jgi:hypothetical protein
MARRGKDGTAQGISKRVLREGQLCRVGGTQVEQSHGGLGDRVDGGSAGDLADVEGGPRIGAWGAWKVQRLQREQGTREHQDRIYRAGIRPRVASRALNGDAKPATGESACDHGVVASTLQRE